MILGIDASNIRIGGGLTHLVEVLRAADPAAHGFDRVVVWSGKTTLSKIDDRRWLDKRGDAMLDGGLANRTLWQRRHLSAAAREAACDVLFVPGGSFAGDFRPMATFHQNLLPFEWRELRRFGVSWMTLKMLLLRRTQGRTFRRADGVIFLTRYAEQIVEQQLGRLPGLTRTIPHGVDRRFTAPERAPRAIEDCSAQNPFRLLYVSAVYPYKHQWHVVEAVSALRAQGLPVTLELIGHAHPPSLTRLEAAIARHDPGRTWVTYAGHVNYEDLPARYAAADLFVFASTCESFGQIVTEAMAMALPVACANRSAMSELLGDAGEYFDAEAPPDIAATLSRLVADPKRRGEMARAALARAGQYSWARCARETLQLLADVARSGRGTGE